MSQFYIIGFCAVFLSFLARYKKFQFCFPLAFLILFLFLSLGYEWGNDVPSYHYFWEQYTDVNYSFLDFNNFKDLNEKNEFVWVSLCILCKPLGFYGFRALLFFIENYILYRFISKKVNRNWYWLAMMVYIFNPFFLVLSSSMMRQWLAICISLVAIECFIEKKTSTSIGLIIFTFFIHRSVCVVFFILLFLSLLRKQDKYSMTIFCVIVVTYFAISNSFVHFIATWLASEDVYSNYSGAASQSGIGITSIGKVIIYLFLFLSANSLPDNRREMLKIPILYCFILPFLSYSTVAARMGFYYTIYTIFAYPIFMHKLKKKIAIKFILLSLVIVYTLYSSYIFFVDPIYKPYYFVYRNLFEVGVL